MAQVQDLVHDHGYTFYKNKLIDFFRFVMLTTSFGCIIDLTLKLATVSLKQKGSSREPLTSCVDA